VFGKEKSAETLLRDAGKRAPAEVLEAEPFGAGVTTGNPASSGDATIDQLEKLTELRDKGALTPEEFEAQKKRILGET